MKIKLPLLALAALLFVGLPLASSSAYVGISVAIAPPAIPVYEQPYCPVEGYLWTPGYWAYSSFGYYWVPGVWVAPPRVGFLWTPGYWGFRGGRYAFNDGYWGPTVGFYGGINYGYGYGGSGYYGGEWAGDSFRYNTAVSRVNTSVITNTYVNNEVVNNTGSRAGFNGPGGAQAKANAQERAAAKASHVSATSAQKSVVAAARKDPALRAKNNQGQPNAKAVDGVRNKVQPAGATAANSAGAGKQAGVGKRSGAKKGKGGAAQEANGNSTFGHKQGDAITRTKGSQNNAYGKAQSADARRGPHQAAKGGRAENPVAPHGRNAKPLKHTGQVQHPQTAPRVVRHAPGASSRPRAAAVRPAGPAGPRGPAASDKPGQKKKKHGGKEGPGPGH